MGPLKRAFAQGPRKGSRDNVLVVVLLVWVVLMAVFGGPGGSFSPGRSCGKPLLPEKAKWDRGF